MTDQGGGAGASSGKRFLAVALWILAVGLIVLVVLLAADDDDDGDSAVSAGSSAAPRPVAAGNVQVGAETDNSVIQAATSPVVAVNPKKPRNYVMGYRIERPDFSCAVAVSEDSGASWSPADLPLPPGTERCYTTSLSFADDGTLHLAFVTLAGPGNVPTGAWLTTSSNGGRTFGAAKQVLNEEKFMVRVAVDSSASPPRVYLTWVEPAGTGLLQMSRPSPVKVAVSTDGGSTFGEPVTASDPDRERTGAPVPSVGRNGALHLLYVDYEKDVFDYENQPGTYDGTFTLLLATSTDGGKTFSQTVVDDDVVPPEPFLVFTPQFPSLAVDTQSDSMYATWSDGRAGEAAALLSASRDGGRTWESPVRVDDGDGDALLPQVSVAPDERVDIAYANVDEAGATQIHFTASSDGGRTFGPIQPLNTPFSRTFLPRSPREGSGPDLGSTLGLVSTESGAYVAWPDTRRGSRETLRADIVGASVDLTTKAEARRPAAAGSER